MPRGKSKRNNSRGSDGKTNNRGGERSNASSSRRGFGAMDEETRRRISAKGGRASHGGGRARNGNND